MMKKLLALGTVLGAAYYLQNKDRRDRLMQRGRGLLDSLRREGNGRSISDADVVSQPMGTSPSQRSPAPPREGDIH
jgi:hypothetical protein